MSKFIKNIIILTLILLSINILLFFIFKYIDNYIIKDNSNAEEHLIFGNSHAMSALDPVLISELTDESFKSYASSGQAIFWSVKGIEKKIAQTLRPIVYIEFTNNAFTTDWWIYDDNRMLREIDKMYQLDFQEMKYLFLNNPSKSLKYFATLPFPSSKLEGKFGINDNDRLKDDIKEKGERILIQYKLGENSNDIDLGVNSLNMIVENYPFVRFVIIRTPMNSKYFEIMKKVNNDRLTLQWLENFRKKSNCIVFDFAHFEMNDSCYADLDHLNYKGAKIFSKVFADTLIDYKKKGRLLLQK